MFFHVYTINHHLCKLVASSCFGVKQSTFIWTCVMMCKVVGLSYSSAFFLFFPFYKLVSIGILDLISLLPSDI